MNINIPKKESIGQGRLVRCSSCHNLNHLGTMISAEYSSEGVLVTKLVCSIGCLSQLVKEVYRESTDST